jgi:hypothetical protein
VDVGETPVGCRPPLGRLGLARLGAVELGVDVDDGGAPDVVGPVSEPPVIQGFGGVDDVEAVQPVAGDALVELAVVVGDNGGFGEPVEVGGEPLGF